MSNHPFVRFAGRRWFMGLRLCSPEEGELVLVRVCVESRQLEDVLEALAGLPFPVNPDLQHDGLSSTIEFPAYDSRLDEVMEALQPFDLPISTISMLETIRGIAAA
jgi:hypothetical protein